MTATTIPQQGLGSRSWNTALQVAAIVALIVVLTIGAFAFGRSLADDGNAVPSSNGATSEAPSCVHAGATQVC